MVDYMNKVMHIQDASKSFGSSTILKNINLTLNSSQVVGLIGSSGSGKTTLLRCILGLLQFEGQRIHPKPLRMGFLLESQRNLYWLLTVREISSILQN
jgi:ABC-type multidrug transport system ATPase subunit